MNSKMSRLSPLGPAMAIGAALTRMAASARKFNVSTVREQDLALVAAVASGDGN